jgi:hypothetical protein|tara:strand:+ start:8379 stop:8591 length:213 start_codon:yes stop_codon:yes gene_type:complete
MKNIETPLTYALVILALLLIFVNGVNNTCDTKDLNTEEEVSLDIITVVGTLSEEEASSDTIIIVDGKLEE